MFPAPSHSSQIHATKGREQKKTNVRKPTFLERISKPQEIYKEDQKTKGEKVGGTVTKNLRKGAKQEAWAQPLDTAWDTPVLEHLSLLYCGCSSLQFSAKVDTERQE